MEGTIGEIRLFAGTFAPQGWMFCQGQTLPISGYEAIFTLIGTIYGGDGASSFNLPNLQSRVVIGAGTAIGSGINYIIGQSGGVEGVTLTSGNIPVHGHTATTQATTGAVTASLTLNAAAGGAGGNPNPANCLIGSDSSTSIYTTDTSRVPSSPMSATAVTFPSTMVTAQAISGVAGGVTPHQNMQPFTTTNYIICVQGIFPSRD